MGQGTAYLETALALYMISAAFFAWALVRGGRISVIASGTAWIGVVAQGVGIVILAREFGHPPFLDLPGSLVCFSWALMTAHLVMARVHRTSVLGVFASFVSAASLISGMSLMGAAAPPPAALLGPWSAVHIAGSLISYVGLALAFGATIAYTLQERLLKAKRITSLQKRLPSLDALDRLSYRMVALAFPVLTLGIVTGSIWAQSAWGSYWNWNPKETWSLITWLVYAAYLHVRVIQGRRSRWATRLLILGFACVLITYLGVSLLTSGHHVGIR